MLHLLLYGVLAIALAGALFALAARFLPAGEQIAPPIRDEPPWELPADRALSPDEIETVRLPVALRGYRFTETDILLDRLALELRSRDEEIARLRNQAGAPVAVARPDEVAEPAEEETAPAEAEPVEAEAEMPVEEPAEQVDEETEGSYWATNAPPWAVTPGQQSGASGTTPRQRRRRRK